MIPEPRFPDRRHDVRRVVNREFGSTAGDDIVYVHDVSRGGVFLRTSSPLPIGTRVRLHCTVVDRDLETLEGVGEVVRAVSPTEGRLPGMGIAFVELTPSSRELVERVLARR